ncbi:hypothetical protein F4779DRAFT_144908 [Xylariaceae sp. FL0662B]|nr:hypothetical protein F4779DRAFT_144908 [Xylariaceae sp. FL0662B]
MFLVSVLRRSQLRSLRRTIVNVQNAASHLPPSQKVRLWSLRFKTTSTKEKTQATPQTPPRKFAYPERLCVYHAGTGRGTFLACLKLSTLFIFVFFGFVVTPAYYKKEGFSPTVRRTTFCAIAPVVFVAYITSPFVAFIHLRLPPFARQSEEMLRRYVKNLPRRTELDITTMSFIAKPRTSKIMLSELKPANRRFGLINLTRDTKAENARRKWYRFRAVGDLNVQLNQAPRYSWAWDSIMNTIKKQQT